MADVIALVLAAGEGTRMGVPKAVLDWGGRTLLDAHLSAALAAGCSQAVGVVRAAVLPLVGCPPGARLIVSSRAADLGPAGSIAAFVEAMDPASLDGLVAITPVDVVPDAWAVLSELRTALQSDAHAQVARPRRGARGGHPVLVRAKLLDAYRGDAPVLRQLLRDAAEYGAALEVSVDDDAVLADLDTPADVVRWNARAGGET